MKNFFKVGITLLVIAAVGYAFGRFTAPDKVIEKERIRTVEVEVEKIVEVVKEVIKEVKVENKNVNTKTTITENPDGTKTTVIEVVDTTTVSTGSESEKDSSRDTDRNTASSTEKDKTKITINKKSQWKLTGMAGLEIGRFSSPLYGGMVEKRILGPIFIGGWALSNKTIGIGVTIEF